MPLAGETIIAGKIPGERIATDIRTTASSAFTVETVVQTVAASLVTGRTYRVSYVGVVQSSVSDGRAITRIREDNLTGTQIQLRHVATTQGSAPVSADLEAEFTAVSTASKTFAVTYERTTGTGNLSGAAGATAPAYLYVDYIRG